MCQELKAFIENIKLIFFYCVKLFSGYSCNPEYMMLPTSDDGLSTLSAEAIEIRYQSEDITLFETHPLSYGVSLDNGTPVSASTTGDIVSTKTAEPDNDDEIEIVSSGGLSTGAKIGIGTGVAILVLIIAIIIGWFLLKKKKERDQLGSPDEAAKTLQPMISGGNIGNSPHVEGEKPHAMVLNSTTSMSGLTTPGHTPSPFTPNEAHSSMLHLSQNCAGRMNSQQQQIPIYNNGIQYGQEQHYPQFEQQQQNANSQYNSTSTNTVASPYSAHTAVYPTYQVQHGQSNLSPPLQVQHGSQIYDQGCSQPLLRNVENKQISEMGDYAREQEPQEMYTPPNPGSVTIDVARKGQLEEHETISGENAETARRLAEIKRLEEEEVRLKQRISSLQQEL